MDNDQGALIREAVLTKWSKEGFLEDIKSDTVKMNTAIILENQYQYLNEAGGTSNNDIAKFKKLIIPMVRRIFPHLITNDIVGVQPMLAPVGLAYALRRQYNNGSCVNTEAGFNTVDQSFSGSFATSAGERLGNDTLLCPVGSGGSNWAEMSISIESVEIRARTRKLRARFSAEVQQDLMAMHNVDVRQELTDLLSYEIGAEIDQEVLLVLKNQAIFGGVFSWNYGTVGSANGSADGRWEQEKFRTLYTVLLKASNDIARATRMGAGNFVLASSDVVAALETLPMFSTSPLDGAVSGNQVAVNFVGKLGRFRVYRDMFALTNYAVVGYKGSGTNDSGVIYSPYVPVLFDETKGQESFHTHLGVMTRYAITENLFGAENYYRFINVNLGDALSAGPSSGSAPVSNFQVSAAGITA